jgi:hypothetical protein
MSATQYFPIPPALFALAGETVSRRVSRLPFLRSGVMVTGELLGVVMECLNAEFNKTLALRTSRDAAMKPDDGLDCCIEARLRMPGKSVVPVIVDVLCSAGIAETTEFLDRRAHRPCKAVRLLPPWTWDAASGVSPAVRPPGSGDEDEPSPSWMSMCPVCRTGILNRVVGKQLFGIPHTDFYIECTYCRAKFIPVGTQFRLVSIATVRDPLWRKHLDQTFPAETWSALARGAVPGGKPLLHPTGKRPDSSPSPKITPAGLTQTKDGSLVVPVGEKTLYFKPVNLNFTGGMREDLFARVQKPLGEIMKNPAFSHLLPAINTRYSRYLPLQTGLFLHQLKERHDPFYREFLNMYGDEKYGAFRLGDSREGDRKGVLVVVVNRGIYAVVNCPDTIRGMINDTFGRILPEDCLLSGDSTRCRINALICNNKKEARIYIHTSGDDAERNRITELLKGFISV